MYPPLHPVESVSVAVPSASPEPNHTANRRGDGTVLYGIRPYRPGENPKRISWKASAKQGSVGTSLSEGWLVREMEVDQKNGFTFLWPRNDFFAGRSLSEIEDFISAAASYFSSSLEKGHEVRLLAFVPGMGRPAAESIVEVASTGGPPENGLMEFLSLVDPFRFPDDAVRPYFKSWDSTTGPAAGPTTVGPTTVGPSPILLSDLFLKARPAHRSHEK